MPRPVEEQLRARGLELAGPCEQMSRWPELRDLSPLLQDFTAAEAELLGRNMLLMRARAGQLLIEEGETSDWMMVLLRGTVDVRKRKVGAGPNGQGENTRLAVLKEGAVVGEISMLDGEPRDASCWALSDIEAAVLGRVAVGRLIAAHPAVGAKLLLNLTQLLAQRLRNLSNQLVKALRKG